VLTAGNAREGKLRRECDVDDIKVDKDHSWYDFDREGAVLSIENIVIRNVYLLKRGKLLHRDRKT
jgi:hypothetical protein